MSDSGKPVMSGEWLGFAVKAMVIFVVVAAGVYVGLSLAVEFDVGARNSDGVGLPANLRNSTALKIGDSFPEIILDLNGEPVALSELLAERKTMLAFVSRSCGPCTQFVNAFADCSLVAGGEYQFLLISTNPDDDLSGYPTVAFRISEEDQKRLAVTIVPTMIGVDRGQTVRFVSCGYTESLNEDYVLQHL